ncbi:alginate lyase family protein [Iamia sp.]|uniref:alginate lyase family protein n=1 Tax=Iamia sp. TaxID=2722710 RepID=UPI002C588E2C|nr:alginate lyase family protein [Iamia sp.]HXH57683.1 alginate lyase family protein [Iamia sp.]
MIDRDTAGLYLRTVSHLRPEQVVHRVRLRAQQAVLARWPEPFRRRWTHRGGQARWPDGFVALDAEVPPACGRIGDLEDGTFSFLNQARALGTPIEWDPVDAPQLWLYHQHYWEWAWTLANEPDRDRARTVFGEHLRSWCDATRFGRWNAWAPYPTSLRAWVFVNVARSLAASTPVENLLREQMRLHAGFVEHNLELDVGGNHLMKNLKALMGLGVYFGDQRLMEKAATLIASQLSVQVLPDGGHFELSPSYHCQVLGDLIDIKNLSEAAGATAVEGLEEAVARMRRWLGAMLMPDGDVPLFNDCERVGPARIAALRPRRRSDDLITVLPESGYVVASPGGRIHLVADVGQPCPPDLPAHAQADCLTFEMAVDGERVIVDPGTSVYGSGPRRIWERSTGAHNTITIDGEDQTEVWGSFRAGRLAQATLHRAEVVAGNVEIEASHTGFAHLDGSPIHRRRWTVAPGSVVITDRLEGSGEHRVRLCLLFEATSLSVEAVRAVLDPEVDAVGFRVLLPRSADRDASGAQLSASVAPAQHALGFGDLRDATELVVEGSVRLPHELNSRIVLVP